MFRTSKMCPCGQDELKDFESNTESGKRVRVHKTTGDVCSVFTAGGRPR